MFPMSDLIPVCVSFSLIAVLLISSVTDLTWHRIPNVLLLSALLLAVALKATGEGLDGMFSVAAGFGVGLAFLMPVYVVGGMAAGDVKLLGVVGAFLGPAGAFIAGIATLIVGALLGIGFMAWRIFRPVLETHTSESTTLTYVGNGHAPVRSYASAIDAERRSGFAYAPAIAGGAVFAMWQQGLLPLLAAA